MRLLLLPVQDEDCRISYRAVGEGALAITERHFSFGSHSLKPLSWLFLKSLFLKPFVVSGRPARRQVGSHRASPWLMTRTVTVPPSKSVLTQPRIPLMLGHSLNMDLEKISALNKTS